MNSSLIENRDYTLLIDLSSSMNVADRPGGKTHWEAAQESTLALAKKCEEIDHDGLTVYLFSSRFKRYNNVTSAKVAQIFAEHEPMGKSNLASVLEDALSNYFARKAAGQTKPNGETILVITDGTGDDRKAVMKMIIEASKQIDRDEELGISFIQVGKDKKVSDFFHALDDQLQGVGAAFDIVNTINMDDMKTMSLAEVLLQAIEG